MLAPATAFVLALALGAAPVPAPEARPVVPEPGGASGAPSKPKPAPSESSPSVEAPTGESPGEEPSGRAPTGDTPTAEPPTPEPPIAEAPPPEDDDPFGEHADEEPWPEEGDDPFGEHADEEPWPDQEGGDRADAEPLPDYDPLRDSPQALRARHWVRMGIGTMAAGGALLVGSILMGASDPCNLKLGNSCQVDARNRAALVMGIPAAILVGGGAAMLGVGLARQRRLAIDLQAGRTSVGVTVRGRF